MKLAVLGANGKMGRAVVRLAHLAGDEIVGAFGAGDEGRDAGELAGAGPLGVVMRALGSDPGALSRADVLIDFSAPAALAPALAACEGSRVAFVCGTTGLGAAEIAALDEAAKTRAVLWEPNMSVGVHVLSALVAKAAQALPGFDVEIVEVHHKAKVDAPSGTALRLGEAVKSAREGRYVNGREGRPGPRAPDELGMHAVRGGDVIGDHTVHLFGEGERIELTHRATSRELFAHGALRAARWLVGRAPGRYRLADVLGGI